MRDIWTFAIVTLAVSAVSAAPAFAGTNVGTPASAIVGASVPFGHGAILGIVAGCVVAGDWMARRKR